MRKVTPAHATSIQGLNKIGGVGRNQSVKIYTNQKTKIQGVCRSHGLRSFF